MFEQAFKSIYGVLWEEAGLHHGAGQVKCTYIAPSRAS